MKIRFLALMLFSIPLWAQAHREQGVHQHGSGSLSIAFDDSQEISSKKVMGRVEFLAAAEGVLGFERAVHSKQDQEALAALINQFETTISSMVRMEPVLSCQFTKDRIGLLSQKGRSGSGTHSDFVADFNIVCGKSPLGTVIGLDFTSLKKVKDIDVTVLVGNLQKSIELKMKPVKLELK